ncbi:MAG: hypothetical protein ACT4TC_25015 [Myxococcaceae bacterium]
MKALLSLVAVVVLGACAARQSMDDGRPRLAVDVPRRAPVKGGPFDFDAARPKKKDPKYSWDFAPSVKTAGSRALTPDAR